MPAQAAVVGNIVEPNSAAVRRWASPSVPAIGEAASQIAAASPRRSVSTLAVGIGRLGSEGRHASPESVSTAARKLMPSMCMTSEMASRAADAAAPAVPQLFRCVDGEPIGSATQRTRPDALDTAAKSDAAPLDFVLDAHGARAVDGARRGACRSRQSLLGLLGRKPVSSRDTSRSTDQAEHRLLGACRYPPRP